MVRRTLRRILEAEPDLVVAGEAADGVAAVGLARRLRPDVAPAGIRMPGRDGIQVTRELAGLGVADPLTVVVPAALTGRELDVARLVARARRNAELVVSPGTVKARVANIQRKLALANRVGIAVWAGENAVTVR